MYIKFDRYSVLYETVREAGGILDSMLEGIVFTESDMQDVLAYQVFYISRRNTPKEIKADFHCEGKVGIKACHDLHELVIHTFFIISTHLWPPPFLCIPDSMILLEIQGKSEFQRFPASSK